MFILLLFPGYYANFLRPSLEAMGITEEIVENSKKIDFGSELDAAKAEAKAWKTIWSAGQGVSSIKKTVPIAQLVAKLRKEFIQSITTQIAHLDRYS